MGLIYWPYKFDRICMNKQVAIFLLRTTHWLFKINIEGNEKGVRQDTLSYIFDAIDSIQ